MLQQPVALHLSLGEADNINSQITVPLGQYLKEIGTPVSTTKATVNNILHPLRCHFAEGQGTAPDFKRWRVTLHFI